ncbi:MAG: hypothetical protein U0169_25980 [Polyangiaceae bacterium]
MSALLATPTTARAQNGDSFYFSNESAATAGAVVSVPGDDGAAYTNPAGLGASHKNRISLNGSVFGVRVRRIPDGLTSTLGGRTAKSDFGGTDFVSTPTAAGASFEVLPGFTMSGGAFHEAFDVRAATDTRSSSGTSRLAQRVNILSQRRKMQIGGAFGFEAGHGVRFGAGMFAVYSVAEGDSNYAAGDVAGSVPSTALAVSTSASSHVWGLRQTVGVQWDATRRLHLGATFRFPEFLLSETGDTSSSSFGVAGGVTFFDVSSERRSTRTLRWVEPARVVAGASFDVSETVRVALDLDVSTSIANDTWHEERRPVLRGRAGLYVRPSDWLHFGLGAFVDPNGATTLPRVVGALRADYVGATQGFLFRTRVGGASSSSVLVTLSGGLRYAVGFGDARTVSISETSVQTGTRAVTIHDVMPYFGSSVAF